MSKWKMVSFEDVFDDCTKYGRKIMKEDYLECGKYPIVDQGQNRIAGYANDDLGIFEDVPAIIFGDHTRIIKYIDEPFFLGADGVKLLKAKEKGTNYKYLFYSLLSAHIPDTGYNRHFKWLKDLQILLPPLEEQKRIADILDKASNLIDLRKQQLEKMDLLIKSKFIYMFGDPVTNSKGWKVQKIGEFCNVTKLAGFEYTKYISYKEHGEVIMVKGLNVKDRKIKLDDISYIDKSVSESLPRSQLHVGDIVMTYVGINIGDVAIIDGSNYYHLAPNVAKISPINQSIINPTFLVNLLYYCRILFSSGATNTAKQALNMEKIRKINVVLPPIKMQNEFVSLYQVVEKQKAVMQQSLEKMETNYKALMQGYFG